MVSETGSRFTPSSKARLTPHDLGRFAGTTLFDRFARVLCETRCLPRKELYEAWEVAKRVRRLFRGGRVVDLAGGHGLLAQALLLLDDSSPDALVVDRAVPASATTVSVALTRVWPRLAGRVRFFDGDLGAVPVTAGDLVVSSHACGALTDAVLQQAADAGARVAVLPCCHDTEACDTGALGGWLDPAMAIDVMRVVELERRGYRVWTQQIPSAVTPKNRLLLGEPRPRAN